MTIVFFSDSYTPYVSGVVRSLELTARELTRRGHRVALVAPGYPGYRSPGVDSTGAYVLRLPSLPVPGQGVFRLPVVALAPLRLPEGYRPDIVHAHSPFLTGTLALRTARCYGVPLVFTHHTLYHEYVHYALLPAGLTRPLVLRAVGRFCREATAVIAPTQAIARLVRQLYGPVGDVATIPTGIDLSAFAGLDRSWLRGRFAIPAGAPVVIHVGRLAREKNVQMLMQTLRRLLEELPALHAVVAGGGPFLARMRAATSEPPFAGRLHLTGPLAPSEVPRHLAGADLFLTASTTETQGLVAVEAMAAGLPVVAPEAGGIPDVVRSGQDGLLVTARPEALAEAARGLLEQPHRLRRLAEHALARSREFGVEHTVSRLEQLYQRLKSAHASGAGQG